MLIRFDETLILFPYCSGDIKKYSFSFEQNYKGTFGEVVVEIQEFLRNKFPSISFIINYRGYYTFDFADKEDEAFFLVLSSDLVEVEIEKV